jgi:hypothetical protein
MTGSETKQVRWIELQRDKIAGGGQPIPKVSSGSFFSQFT